jgi:hypothetical protein
MDGVVGLAEQCVALWGFAFEVDGLAACIHDNTSVE